MSQTERIAFKPLKTLFCVTIAVNNLRILCMYRSYVTSIIARTKKDHNSVMPIDRMLILGVVLQIFINSVLPKYHTFLVKFLYVFTKKKNCEKTSNSSCLANIKVSYFNFTLLVPLNFDF